MYDTTIAAKLLGQLESFLGRISPHFHKPVARFIGDMVYGIMVEKDVKLASIVRALKEKTTPKKVEDRLSRMLSSDGLEAGLHGVIASEGARRVRRPQPEVQRDRPASSAFAGHGHAAPEAEVVAHVAFAAVPDLGKVLHLLRVGLLHVGRVQDDERVLVDLSGAL